MPLPPERVITGTYVNPVNGEPYDGTDGSNYVIFEPIPDRWTDQGGNQILLGGGKVTLDENGHFEESVVRTDADDVLPSEGRLWRLRQFIGGSWNEAVFAVPAGTGSLDITDILSVDICGVDYVPIPGPPGSTGPTGPEGDSAYAVAVENGFTGTEEEWLASLVGPQGEPGLNGGMDTGIATGGDISVNASNPLAVDINPLTGQIVNYLVNPVTVEEVVSPTVLTVELDDIAQTRTITWLLMDAELNVFQQEARPGPEDRRNFIVLGLVAQDDGAIFLAQSLPVIARQPVNQLYDLMDAIGAFGISGNDVSPNGANLQLNVGSGQVFSRGWNHFDGPSETNNPHITTTVGASPASWTHALRSSDLEHASSSAVIDVGHYDDAGVLTTVGGDSNTSVVHQLWMFPTNEGSEVHVLQYGQTTYSTLQAAFEAAGKETFAINPALPGNAINLGFLAVRGQATDLSDTGDAIFVKAGKFGSGPGGGAAVDLSGYAQLAGAEFTGQISSLRPSGSSIAQSSRTVADSSDLWRRLTTGEMQWGPGSGPMDSFLRRLGVGLLAFLNTDFQIGQENAKAYRFRQSGSSLDLDASGADLFISVFELVNFLGEQRSYLRLESGSFIAHAGGVWRFGDGSFDSTTHTIDGLNDQLGFHGATPVGQQTISGERTTGTALQSLLEALDLVGLISDTSTAGPDMVETVNGEAGPDVTLSAADVGAVDEDLLGVADGVATLGPDGKVPSAQIPTAPVTSVNSETGDVVLDAADVGAIDLDEKGANNGVATLDNTGKVTSAQLPTAPVVSVNGETGEVVLTAADVGALTEAEADGLYMAQDSLWINGADHGVVGDGTTDDAPAINSILASSPAGSVITLPPRAYATGVPIVVPPGKTLMGLRSDLMTVTDLYEPNVVIKPLVTFTGVAAIRFLDATTGGYADISGEQRVLNLTLDGSNVAAGVDGIQAKGNVQNVALRDVTIRRFPNSGIYCGLEGGIAPYSWRMHRVMLDNNHAHGMFGERMVDLTAVDCQAIGNWSNGWMLQNAANSQMIGCRAEWNGNNGFYLSGDWGNGAGSGGMLMSGCSTDRNGFNGVYLDCTGTPPIVISNLMTRRDGRNGGAGGGGYAGVATNGATTPVVIGDWTNFPGVDDGGGSTNSPDYGGSFTDSSFVQIQNALLHAAVGGIFDAGDNEHLQIGADVNYAVGTTSSFVRSHAKGRYDPPYVFNVMDYGAKGDGKVAVDAAMTSGSATLTCATSAPFTAADVNKNIQVLNAGTSGETIVGTIATYISPTQVTLSVTAASTITSGPVLWSSDDTDAIQNAVDAAVTYALAHSYAATVYFPPAAGAFYGVAGALKTGGSTLGNAQITLPVVPTTGRKLTLVMEGAQVGSGVQHWQQTFPNTTGSTIVSFGMFANTTAQINSINAAGNAAVIGGPSQPGGYGVAPGVFSNVYFDIGNMSILTCHSRNGLTYSALDLSGLANARLRDLAYSTSGTVAPPGASYQNPNLFATGLAIGCLLPANGANDNTLLTNVTIGGGYTYGILVTEHTDIYGLRILYCWAGLCPVGSYFSSVGAAHSIHGTLISIEVCTFLIYIFGPGTGGLGPTMYLKIDTETSIPRLGDRTSGTGLAAARGEVVLAGLFTAANLTLDSPTGLRLVNSQLTFPVTEKTANYTAISFDQVILVNAASGGVTITLPTAVGRTDPITVKKTDSSGNTVTLDGNGSQTIDGATTKVLSAQWEVVTIIPSGGNWYII